LSPSLILLTPRRQYSCRREVSSNRLGLGLPQLSEVRLGALRLLVVSHLGLAKGWNKPANSTFQTPSEQVRGLVANCSQNRGSLPKIDLDTCCVSRDNNVIDIRNSLSRNSEERTPSRVLSACRSKRRAPANLHRNVTGAPIGAYLRLLTLIQYDRTPIRLHCAFHAPTAPACSAPNERTSRIKCRPLDLCRFQQIVLFVRGSDREIDGPVYISKPMRVTRGRS